MVWAAQAGILREQDRVVRLARLEGRRDVRRAMPFDELNRKAAGLSWVLLDGLSGHALSVKADAVA